MNPDQWKDFINALFVRPDGSRKSAMISLTLKTAQGELTLPSMEMRHSDTLQDIFRSVRDLDLMPQSNDDSNPVPTQVAQRLKAVNVEHIQHQSSEYLVYRMNDDSFQVRKSDGQLVQPKTIIYNSVVKKYREKFHLE